MYLFYLSQKFDICFLVAFFFFGDREAFFGVDYDSDITYELSRIFTADDCGLKNISEMSLFLVFYFFCLATSVGVKEH